MRNFFLQLKQDFCVLYNLFSSGCTIFPFLHSTVPWKFYLNCPKVTLSLSFKQSLQGALALREFGNWLFLHSFSNYYPLHWAWNIRFSARWQVVIFTTCPIAIIIITYWGNFFHRISKVSTPLHYILGPFSPSLHTVNFCSQIFTFQGWFLHQNRRPFHTFR